jgi:hypothetical protein
MLSDMAAASTRKYNNQGIRGIIRVEYSDKNDG